MKKGNKGEWSEIYVLLKLLGDGKLFSGNEHFQIIEDFFFPIIKIIRFESGKKLEFAVEDEIILITENEIFLKKISISTFKEKATFLLKKIQKNHKGTFAVSEIEAFLHELNCLTLKAKSSKKTDITIIIHDFRTNRQPILGFSIKSQLGGASTLLNAGKTTNFIYQINNLNLSNDQILEINSINSTSKIKDRVREIINRGGSFEFIRTEKITFANNLFLIDSKLPEILATILYDFFTSKRSKIEDLVSQITSTNPLNFDTSNKHEFYEYKIKRFLTDIALGMMPSKVWNGKYDATGGYIIIKNNGDLLCYHLYNKNIFEDYLAHNTKLETSSSTRYDYGTIYKKEENLYFKLNLQIRFTK